MGRVHRFPSIILRKDSMPILRSRHITILSTRPTLRIVTTHSFSFTPLSKPLKLSQHSISQDQITEVHSTSPRHNQSNYHRN